MHGIAMIFILGVIWFMNDESPVPVFQSQFDRIGEPSPDAFLDDQPVDHKIERMFFVLVQRGNFVDAVHPSVYAHAHETFGLYFLEPVGMCSLLQFHQRSHEDDARAFGQTQNIGNDFVRGARLDGTPALGAVHFSEPGVKDAQKVIDFGDGAHRGTRVAPGGLLFEGNGGGKPFDLVHVRLVHLGKELSGVGGERLHIAPLAFGIDDVKSQRGLA